MLLPKWATTVTPLSKAIALLIFIILPFIGFILGMKYQQMRDFTNGRICDDWQFFRTKVCK